jgi:lipid A 3-O-deacylase
LFRILNRTIVLSLLVGIAALAHAETPETPSGSLGAPVVPAKDLPTARTWEFGPFLQGGSGIGTRDDFQFFAVGFQAGKNLTPVLHAGPLTGRFEFGVNVMPLWQAYTPAAHNELVTVNGVTAEERIGGGTYTGFSVTPVIFRWNLGRGTGKWQPWVQAAGGMIYTTHKFPGTIEVPKGTPGGTSVWNFSPQGGGGFHYFLAPRRSIDFGLNAVHISSASLGDRNPGVNASLQMQVGYSWWK